MSRPPRARAQILAAARQIVEREGAGALTFEELSRVSGLTRGGITYHFPTKDALLRGLLEHDLEQWRESEAACTPDDLPCPSQRELLGFIRSHTSQDDRRRRFVAGMLSAAVHRPELLDGCREEIRARFHDVAWTESALRGHLLRLAAVGLFWEDVFQIPSLPPPARARLVELLERLALDWAGDEPDSTPCRKDTSA